ncbi:heme ABC transporter ATP-binding protein [Nocardioides gilvus]|uniref:heme ABC transporter ATP-binding protein n=1 Tax=Nocardioides gilvus TaxID=1735589 RepID=UPI000D74BC59|nr:heme ABC transporter ATP-binding protein [Nocardioides gilvus]
MTSKDSAPAPALRAQGVSYAIGDAQILREVDLDVRHGEVVALVGPNGAGKSTLLSVLAGDVEPDAGVVELDGVQLHGQRPEALARQRAVLLQRQGLAFGFRVREVVEMGRSVWRRDERAVLDEKVIEESMEIADVSHLAARVVPTLSGGEQARVSFARLLAQDVEIHLLDEPTAALDIKHQEAVLSQARDSARRGAAVVVVLHDLSLAAAYSDRVCVLAGGQVRATGTPDEVLTGELLSEVYEHPVEVLNHAGTLLVVPVRRGVRSGVLSRETKESSCPVLH